MTLTATQRDLFQEIASRWTLNARPKQLPPQGAWRVWFIRCGRGWGKNRTGAEWVLQRVRQGFTRIALVGETKADVRDTMIEVGDSSILRCARPEERPLYEPSKRRLTFPNGAIAIAYSGDDPDQLRGPQHDTCFVHGTMILSRRGTIPIQEIQPGDQVLTRAGFQEVKECRHRWALVGGVEFDNGVHLLGTFEHPILSRSGWVALGDLAKGDTVWSLTGKRPQTDIWQPTSQAERFTNTDMSGSRSMAPFRKVITSTTRTEIPRTTPSKISNSLHRKPTETIIPRLPSQSLHSAQSVGGLIYGFDTTPDNPSVEGARCGGQKRTVKPCVSVSNAVGISNLEEEITAVSVVSTWEPAGEERVYNISVSVAPEYFANGILVHNCWVDELAKFQYPKDTWMNLQMGLRIGPNPQALITTTPRPIQILKEIQADPATVLVTGSTRENEENLSPDFIAEITRRYAGTRLGRQELEGEILDDNPLALWKRDMIENLRVREAPPRLVRIVVGVDPAVSGSEEAAETGIITAGLAADGTFYILNDRSLRGSPNEWAHAVSKAYFDTRADRVIGEVNNGGDLVEVNLRTVDRLISYKAVHATRGKVIRAEPIAALYEQGKVHHVGTFPQLEDQMCEWVPGDRSPDRMDALVWAMTELAEKGVSSAIKPKYAVPKRPGAGTIPGMS